VVANNSPAPIRLATVDCFLICSEACSGQEQSDPIASKHVAYLETSSGALQANGQKTAVKQALTQLLSDFLSAILFLVVYVMSGSVFAAAAVAVTAGLVQLAGLRLTRRRIEPTQWMSLGLVIVLLNTLNIFYEPRRRTFWSLRQPQRKRTSTLKSWPRFLSLFRLSPNSTVSSPRSMN
jgi:hypothetical protein